MAKHKPPKPSGGGGRHTNLASCIVATVFLIFIAVVILIVYFTVFKPQDLSISVNAIQLPTFSVADANSTVDFTFSQYVTIHNPNRADFNHYESSLQLLYAGNQVGFMFIPAGKIDAGKTEYMAATFSVQSFPVYPVGQPTNVVGGPTVTDGLEGGIRAGPSMEIESRLVMAGRVRVLHIFSHHLEGSTDCRATVSITDGSVYAFHC